MAAFFITTFGGANPTYVICRYDTKEIVSRDYPYTAEGARSAKRIRGVFELAEELNRRRRNAPPISPCRFLLQPIEDVECQFDADEEREAAYR
jgi:hypothetical protein